MTVNGLIAAVTAFAFVLVVLGGMSIVAMWP